eukprot:5705166-Pyramimonas_sp.AAC.2
MPPRPLFTPTLQGRGVDKVLPWLTACPRAPADTSPTVPGKKPIQVASANSFSRKLRHYPRTFPSLRSDALNTPETLPLFRGCHNKRKHLNKHALQEFIGRLYLRAIRVLTRSPVIPTKRITKTTDSLGGLNSPVLVMGMMVCRWRALIVTHYIVTPPFVSPVLALQPCRTLTDALPCLPRPLRMPEL